MASVPARAVMMRKYIVAGSIRSASDKAICLAVLLSGTMKSVCSAPIFAETKAAILRPVSSNAMIATVAASVTITETTGMMIISEGIMGASITEDRIPATR